jgi:hypothetical protein
VTGSTVTDKPFNIIVESLLVVLLLDQPLGLVLTRVGCSNTTVSGRDQSCIEWFSHNKLAVSLKESVFYRVSVLVVLS